MHFSFKKVRDRETGIARKEWKIRAILSRVFQTINLYPAALAQQRRQKGHQTAQAERKNHLSCKNASALFHSTENKINIVITPHLSNWARRLWNILLFSGEGSGPMHQEGGRAWEECDVCTCVCGGDEFDCSSCSLLLFWGFFYCPNWKQAPPGAGSLSCIHMSSDEPSTHGHASAFQPHGGGGETQSTKSQIMAKQGRWIDLK